ncbi:TonB-dependent siderophore receptor [Plastoroseomonas hellenica]|uniref:TonB-dependent siderophore receptor n=1 Tax=Plastoroseomonas hellenica TaxID=2687306 RepID=UPI0020121B67|nr:TonB-dependent siderophore receptor [Plastoroseomonas hellenica]
MTRDGSGLPNWPERARRISVPLAAALLATTAVGALPACAQPSPRQAQAAPTPAFQFQIAPQPLASALNAFSTATGWEVGYPADLGQGVASPGTTGRQTAAEALVRLLAGTGLFYRLTGPTTVTLVRMPAGGSADGAVAVPEVRVDAGLPQGWTPVRGYVAEIAATGTKTDTPIIETPQSISVVTRDQIEAQSAHNLNAIMRYTPGVAVETRGVVGRLDQYSIRGFTAPQFLDGMRTFGGRDANPSVDPFRLERVDILRGPASVLFGQSGPGGLVNLVSKRPTEQPYRELMLQGGSWGTFRVGLDLSGALNEDRTILGRVITSYSRSDSQIDHAREERYFIAPSITFRPTEDTSITLLGLYQRDPWGGTYGAVPAYGSALPNPRGRISSSLWDGDPGFDRLNRTQYQIGWLAEHRFNDWLTVRQNFRYARTEGHYRQLYGIYTANLLADFRTVQRGITGTNVAFDSVTLDNQIEGRFRTGPVQHTLLAGLDYYTVSSRTFSGSSTAGVPAQDVFAPVYNIRVPTLAYQTRARQEQNGVGLYMQDQIRFGPIAIQLGGRQDWYDTESRTETLATGGIARSQMDTSAFTGRAGIVYLTDIGLAPYYSYTESFEPQSGTFSPARGSGPFEPTAGQQHEIGIRYQPPGSNTLISLAAFDLRRQNVLTTDPNDSRYSVQTGEVRTRGIELEAKASLAAGFDIAAAYTYLDSEVTGSNATATASTGIIGTPAHSRPERGTVPIGVPRHMASIWGSYTFQEGSPMAGLALGAGVRYVGATWGDTANTLRVPDYTLVDLMARYDLGQLSPTLQGTSLQVNVTNLFDKDYVASCNTYAWCWYGFRRTVLATLRHRF